MRGEQQSCKQGQSIGALQGVQTAVGSGIALGVAMTPNTYSVGCWGAELSCCWLSPKGASNVWVWTLLGGEEEGGGHSDTVRRADLSLDFWQEGH